MPVASRADAGWMRRALDLAAQAEGETNPNPLVGCVIVQAGRIVGQGYHTRAGAAHAEIVALERAGERARGATLYVNLEPCAHQGRTPACAPRLAAAGVRRVVAAMRDPNPLVDGRGLRLLRRQGVEVEVGVLKREAFALNERFVAPFRTGRPFVLLKAAMTLDGRIATVTRDSKWITSAALRARARRLRRLHDAVLVGLGTVVADDPLLLPSPRVRRPFARVVLDSHFRIPLTSRLVRTARRVPLIVAGLDTAPGRRRALEALGVRVLVDPRGRERVRLPWVLTALAREGVASLMVEGGSEVLGTFLAERLFDKLALFRAPALLGGRGSLPAFGGPDPLRIQAALRLRRDERQRGLAARGLGAADLPVEYWYPLP